MVASGNTMVDRVVAMKASEFKLLTKLKMEK